jgi:predicted branched-subunit amino acid permease
MRGSYLRDWIAWSLLAAIGAVVGTEYYVQRTTGMSTPEYVYKIVVTPSSSQ